jgi:kynureninase
MVVTKVFYEKVGRQYRPVLEYDSEVMDSFPQGDHLVSVRQGMTSRRYRIDPTLAPMIAAGLYAQDAMMQAMIQAAELRPTRQPITPEQQQAWQALARAFGEELTYLQGPAAHEVVAAGIKSMQTEAERLMTNTAVRQAYEQFLLVCELARRPDNERTR